MTRPMLRLAALMAVAVSFEFGPSTAQAQQYVVAPGQTVVMTPATPIVGGGAGYARTTRHQARRPGRYKTMRPTYDNREGLTFAPYSDRYAPRTVRPQTYYYPVNPR